MPQPGDVLADRYRVVGNLSRGGMGVLLRAEDELDDREVAIKFVSPRLARTGNFRERFEREVELATRLDHPHVIRCHDHGVTPNGALFLVMELLDGIGLRELIRNEGRLGTARTVHLGLQLLDGLAAAHRHGIVHRDLKPDNVYVVVDDSGQEVVKLLDFGLAKSLEDEHVRLTKTGMICGTAAYVAPETLVVESPGREADVYAVGLILLEMMFGRRVYSSPQMAQTFMEQLVVPARIPRRVWDQPLGRIIARALQKHPGERYADAGQMHDALLATVEHTADFILATDELPPAANELPRELLDELADGRYRTVDTLYMLPNPEPWDTGGVSRVDDRETLQHVLDEISRSDIHAAFETILRPSEVIEDDEASERLMPWWIVVLVVALALLVTAVIVLSKVEPAPEPSPEKVEETTDRAFTPGPFTRPLPEPGPSDWLAERKESGQTFEEFERAETRNVPTAERRVIYLQPVGSFGGARVDLEQMRAFTATFFQLPVVVSQPIALDGLTLREHPDFGRQVRAGDVLDLLRERVPVDAFCVLAITMEDLYPSDSWNFVFGLASLVDRVGVFSLARYGPRDEERLTPSRQAMLTERAFKVLSHEIGHMFGIQHCTAYLCGMNGSNHMRETDRSPLNFCPVCLRKLQSSIGFDVAARDAKLAKVLEDASLDRAAQWYLDRREWLLAP